MSPWNAFFHASASEFTPTLELIIGFLIPGFDLERGRCPCCHVLFLHVDLKSVSPEIAKCFTGADLQLAQIVPIAAVELGQENLAVFCFFDRLACFLRPLDVLDRFVSLARNGVTPARRTRKQRPNRNLPSGLHVSSSRLMCFIPR